VPNEEVDIVEGIAEWQRQFWNWQALVAPGHDSTGEGYTLENAFHSGWLQGHSNALNHIMELETELAKTHDRELGLYDADLRCAGDPPHNADGDCQACLLLKRELKPL